MFYLHIDAVLINYQSQLPISTSQWVGPSIPCHIDLPLVINFDDVATSLQGDGCRGINRALP